MSDIRRYTLSQIEEMRRRGDVRVIPGAPEGPAFDDDDWEEAFPGEADAGPSGSEAVPVSLDRAVVEAIRRERPDDWRGYIEQILSEHTARSRTSARSSRRSRR